MYSVSFHQHAHDGLREDFVEARLLIVAVSAIGAAKRHAEITRKLRPWVRTKKAAHKGAAKSREETPRKGHRH